MRETSLDDFLTGSDDDEPEPATSGDGLADEPDETADGPGDSVGGPDETTGEDAESKQGTAATEGKVEHKGENEAVNDTVTPTESTYAWTPGGVDCADCGATVERRWWDSDAFVCTDCKTW